MGLWQSVLVGDFAAELLELFRVLLRLDETGVDCSNADDKAFIGLFRPVHTKGLAKEACQPVLRPLDKGIKV